MPGAYSRGGYVAFRIYEPGGVAHATAIVADAGRSGQRVLAVSQNFSAASLGYNRELGILTSYAHIVAAISATLAGDYGGAAAYSPPPASRSGARCTATATADGYSHSYRTDGSGYALIYLNGPPPGTRITVTVGGATCTTATELATLLGMPVSGPHGPPGIELLPDR